MSVLSNGRLKKTILPSILVPNSSASSRLFTSITSAVTPFFGVAIENPKAQIGTFFCCPFTV